jgi:hypothetical protein
VREPSPFQFLWFACVASTLGTMDKSTARWAGEHGLTRFLWPSVETTLYSLSMKRAVLAIIAVVSLPALSLGQSTLSFPRVMQAQDFITTGFAIVNPAATNASVTFTLFDASGSSRGTVSQTIPSRGQLAKLASELFPGATTTGWVQATSAVAGLQGFWFAGDFVSFADGAEAAPSSTELVLPLINPGSEIDITNTGTTDVTLLLDLLGTDGFDLAMPLPQRLPPKGFLKADMSSLFTGLNDYSLPSHMRITCGCTATAFAATVVARDLVAAPSWSVSNGVPVSSAATTIFFPRLVEGPQGAAIWRSVLGITNLSTTSSNNVTITFSSELGGVVRTNQQTLPPNGGLRFGARDLFAITSGFQSGWVRVTSTSGLPVTGYIAVGDLVGSGVAVVPPQQDAQANLLFTHIADLPPWLTGIALLNTNTAAANIDVFAITPNGSLIGSTSFSLGAGANTARLLRELIPQTQTRTSDGGFVFVRSTLPIYGIELFFLRNLQVIGNVAAGRLGPGITFVPPQ